MTDTAEPVPAHPSGRGISPRAVAARQAWQEQKRRTTRDAIRRAGRRLLAEGDYDYDAFTVARIAEAAGVSQMTFFRHFPTKEDFVIGMMIDDRTLQEIRDAIARQPAGAPALRISQSVIHELVAQLSATGLGRLARWARLIAAQPSLLAALHGHRSGWIDTIETLLHPDLPPGQDLARRMTALLLLDHMVETLTWWAARTDPGAPDPAELLALADTAAEAIRAAGGQQADDRAAGEVIS